MLLVYSNYFCPSSAADAGAILGKEMSLMPSSAQGILCRVTNNAGLPGRIFGFPESRPFFHFSPLDIHRLAMYCVAMINKELVAASTEPLILSLLADGESYGYALIQEVKRLSGDKIAWTDGMLYPVLHRMERCV